MPPASEMVFKREVNGAAKVLAIYIQSDDVQPVIADGLKALVAVSGHPIYIFPSPIIAISILGGFRNKEDLVSDLPDLRSGKPFIDRRFTVSSSPYEADVVVVVDQNTVGARLMIERFGKEPKNRGVPSPLLVWQRFTGLTLTRLT